MVTTFLWKNLKPCWEKEMTEDKIKKLEDFWSEIIKNADPQDKLFLVRVGRSVIGKKKVKK